MTAVIEIDFSNFRQVHEILYAEGSLAESMLTGTEALKALNDTAREEIAILFPELQNVNYIPAPARILFAGWRARKAIEAYARQSNVVQYHAEFRYR